MNYLKKNIIFILLALFVLNSCQNQSELTMERGIQYFEWNLIDKAILEFNQVIHMFPGDTKKLNYNQIKILSQAHHNLAVAYAKKEWYKDAEREAKSAFELIPSSENRRVWDLIKDKSP